MPKLNMLYVTTGSLLEDKEPGNQVRNLDGRATVSGEYVFSFNTGLKPEVRNSPRTASQET